MRALTADVRIVRPSKELAPIITPKRATITIRDQGGLARDREARAVERLTSVEARSDADFQAAQDRWTDPDRQSGMRSETLRAYQRLVPSVDLSRGREADWPTITLPSGKVIRDLDVVKCVFCGTFVPTVKATRGQGPLSKTYKDEIQIINGIQILTRKMIHFTSKAYACPDCCLEFAKVRTKVTKSGKVIDRSYRTRFAEMKG